MANVECPHAYRKKGDISLYCHELERRGYLPYCDKEYYCQQVMQFELKPEAIFCDLRNTSNGKPKGT